MRNIFIILVAIFVSWFSPTVHAEEYEGWYICTQGKTKLKLTIDNARSSLTGSTLTGLFSFVSPDGTSGSFKMNGQFFPDRKNFQLKALEWVFRPANYATVDLSGRFSDDREYITGTIDYPGCSSFKVARTGLSGALAMSPSAQQITSIPSTSISTDSGGAKTCTSSGYANQSAYELMKKNDECVFFTHFINNKDGTVTDPRNGLVWKRCPEGYDFSNGSCIGNQKYAKWVDAKDVARSSNFLGKNDWRLPTDKEFLSVLGNRDYCKNNKDKNQLAASKALIKPEGSNLYWSSTFTGSAYVGRGDFIEGELDSGFLGSEYVGRPGSGAIRLVRDSNCNGGSPTPEFADELTKRFSEKAKIEEAHRKERDRISEIERNKVSDFRRSLKEGDSTNRGLVIQIKGELVKIQTNDSQCSQRDYRGDCTNYIRTPAERWFKRNEIYPQ